MKKDVFIIYWKTNVWCKNAKYWEICNSLVKNAILNFKKYFCSRFFSFFFNLTTECIVIWVAWSTHDWGHEFIINDSQLVFFHHASNIDVVTLSSNTSLNWCSLLWVGSHLKDPWCCWRGIIDLKYIQLNTSLVSLLKSDQY